MPHRLVSLAILIAWACAATALFTRDVLPDWILGPPPDLGSVIQSGDVHETTNWILQMEERQEPGTYRSIGRVESTFDRKRDGDVRMTSLARFYTEGLVPTLPARQLAGTQLQVQSVFDVSSGGNLTHFRTSVESVDEPDGKPLLILEGRLEQGSIVVRAWSPERPQLSMLNWTRSFPYQARGMVQSALGPLDRMPGLKVGQRWESRVINPLTGQVEAVVSEVSDTATLVWNNAPLRTLLVTTHIPTQFGTITSRTWVAPDGQVLRQEVPLPFVRLSLEREPEPPTTHAAQDSRGSNP